MNHDAGLAALRAGLHALGIALDHDDLAAAAVAMDAYDRDLRGFLRTRGAEAPVAGLQELLRMQDQLLQRMDTLRRGVAGQLDRARRGSVASRAYVEAGAGA